MRPRKQQRAFATLGGAQLRPHMSMQTGFLPTCTCVTLSRPPPLVRATTYCTGVRDRCENLPAGRSSPATPSNPSMPARNDGCQGTSLHQDTGSSSPNCQETDPLTANCPEHAQLFKMGGGILNVFPSATSPPVPFMWVLEGSAPGASPGSWPFPN